MFVEEREELKFETNRGRDAFVDEIIEICDNYLVGEVLDEVSDLLDCPHYNQK